jgi:catechol 2,3-dioxygenase-like lactoylglutathione lyase family enzyme
LDAQEGIQLAEDRFPDHLFEYPIVFLPCRDLQIMRNFYTDILGLPVALDQGDCVVFRIGEKARGYWGFCTQKTELTHPEKVCLTLVVSSREEVDQWHRRLVNANVRCTQVPRHNQRFHIYHTFFQDPMGYTLEIQVFEIGHAPC